MELWKSARWIWAEGYGRENVYLDAETAFRKEPGEKVLMAISADTDYAFTLGGKLFFGQYADYPFDKVYDLLNLTDCAEDGENRLVIRVYHQGADSFTARKETAGLIFEIFSGERLAAFSGADTAVRPSAGYTVGREVEWVSSQLGYSFRFDAAAPESGPLPTACPEKPLPKRARPVEKLILGPEEPGSLTVSGSFRENGGRTTGERMQFASLRFDKRDEKRILPAKDGILLTAPEGEDGVFALIDVGRESTGILSLDLETEEEAEILVGWGEHLEDLRVRTSIGYRNFAASYRAKAGRNRFLHPFLRLGMRYLALHARTKKLLVRYAGIRTTLYPLAHEWAFSAADALHERIFEVSKRTLRLCMHEHYEDCPWREQALYTMDSRNQMLCGYLAFGETAFPRESLRLIAESIREDDMLEICSPARGSITIPSFTAVFPTQVYEYMVYSERITGSLDEGFLREMLPVLLRIADGFLRRRDPETGLIACLREAKYWNFYEWQEGLTGSVPDGIAEEDATFDAPLCAFVSFGLRSLAGILSRLGEEELAGKYREASFSLNRDIERAFWDEKKKAFASFIRIGTGERFHFAELTNSLILYAGAAGEEKAGAVRERLASGTGLIPITLSHSVFKYDALMMKKEKYARLVFRDIAEKWGGMLEKGATSFWETGDGAEAFGLAGSLCHGWTAIPIRFYAEYAAGMKGEETGVYEARMEKIR